MTLNDLKGKLRTFLGPSKAALINHLQSELQRERGRANAADQRAVHLQMSLDFERERQSDLVKMHDGEMRALLDIFTKERIHLHEVNAQLMVQLKDVMEKSLSGIQIAGEIVKAAGQAAMFIPSANGDQLPDPSSIHENDMRAMERRNRQPPA